MWMWLFDDFGDIAMEVSLWWGYQWSKCQVAQGDPELALELQKAQIGSAALTDVDNSLLFKMAIEIVDFYPAIKWWFSIVMLVYQRVYMLIINRRYYLSKSIQGPGDYGLLIFFVDWGWSQSSWEWSVLNQFLCFNWDFLEQDWLNAEWW